MKKIAFVGVDYHLNSLSIAVLPEGDKDFYQTIHLKNDDRLLAKYLKKVSKNFELRVCYEACSSGYDFQRKLNNWGYHCDIIAPSLIPKKSGDRRKNDFRDCRNLAQLYAGDMLTVVHPPTEEQEAVRSLIRCRLAFKEDEKRTKHRINSFLLTQGYHWQKSTWTKQHQWWLSKLEMPSEYLQKVLDEHLGHLEYLESRIQHLDEQIEQIAGSELYAASVKKLRVLKGIGTLTAMVLIAEITDFRRFPTPKALMAFLGLIPSEESSGDERKGGPITKAGNVRCRTCVVEAVQHYVSKPKISSQMKANLAEVDGKSANIAVHCMYRLHKRFWSLSMKGKIRPVAITAIAREFVGFIWAMMRAEMVEA